MGSSQWRLTYEPAEAVRDQLALGVPAPRLVMHRKRPYPACTERRHAYALASESTRAGEQVMTGQVMSADVHTRMMFETNKKSVDIAMRFDFSWAAPVRTGSTLAGSEQGV